MIKEVIIITEGIYLISNKKSDNVYIGHSKNIENRIKQHFSQLRNNYHSNKNMQKVFNEFGEKEFEWKVWSACKREKRR